MCYVSRKTTTARDKRQARAAPEQAGAPRAWETQPLRDTKVTVDRPAAIAAER